MTLQNTTLPNLVVAGAITQSPLTGYEEVDVMAGPVSNITTVAGIADTALADQSVTALGTNRATAYAIVGQVTNVTTTGSGTGVVLNSAIKPGMKRWIYNNGSNALAVYALGTDTIDGVAGGTGVSIPIASGALFTCIAAGKWISTTLAGSVGGGGVLAPDLGGTGVANANTSTITLAGSLTTTGAFNTTLAQGASNTYTLPANGGTLSNSLVNTFYTPDVHLCTAEVDVTSSTALVNVTGMVQTVVPGTYLFDIDLTGTSGASGGWKLAFNYTTATLTSINATGLLYTAAAVAVAAITTTTTQTTIVGATAANIAGRIWGTMVVSLGGTVQLQFAQNASNGTASSIFVGSKMTFTRIA